MEETEKMSVAEAYGRVTIYRGFPFYYYEVAEPDFSGEEKAISEYLSKLITGKVSIEALLADKREYFSRDFASEFRAKIMTPVTYFGALENVPTDEEMASLKASMSKLLKAHIPMAKNPEKVADWVLGQSIGYGQLSTLIADQQLEEIMVNGYDTSVFVYHKKYGPCKTNLNFSSRKDLDSLLQKIAETVGKKLDAENPLLDARLPDGNRANATFSSVTLLGPTLTIRKFSSVPMSIIDLISFGTMSSELAAFLWVMVDGLGIEPLNVIITGGSGSGKTTTLNAFISFIRSPERVVTIEDTPEIQLGKRENWVQMEARPKMTGSEGLSMDDLLKNALRMRPDRIIVGEVRGKEAETLFVAMDTGHNGCMGTIHSNSAKEMLLRLKSAPMNVPDVLVPLLDLIVVQYYIYVKGKGIQRRVSTVTEVSSMEKQALLSNVFEWDRNNDVLKRTDVPCALIETIGNKAMKTKKEVEQEILVRKTIIDWMLKKGIRSYDEVGTIIQQYYFSPNELLQRVMS